MPAIIFNRCNLINVSIYKYIKIHTMKHIKAFILLLVLSATVNTQWLYNFNCGMTDTLDVPGTSLFGTGMTKPMSTLPLNNTDVYYRVLLVYVEFKNDVTGETTYWEPGEIPTYGNNLFASEKELGINAYEGKYISNYFNKISNDQFDMVGDVVHLTLPYEYSHYSSGNCYNEAMLDVMKMLDTNEQSQVDWTRYDLWKWNNSTQEFEMSPDGNIDMMYVQFRRADMCGMTSGGYGALYVDYSTINYNKQVNGCGLCFEGSGVMGINGWKMPIGAAIGYFRHEYCHYTLGNHRPYSTIAGGDGTHFAFGYELGFAPQDLITVGLADITTYTGSTNSFTLEDLQTTGEVLKIPTTNSGEYFLVSNRRRIAGDGDYTWDCNMAGDTAMGEPFKQFRDYSKGLYIYHVSDGSNYESMVDLECADGLWNWGLNGTSTPDWDAGQILPVFYKTGIGRNDDNPSDWVGSSTRVQSRDGHSVSDYTNSTSTGYHNKWFTIGERHTSLGDKGIDRVFTNNEEQWCSRETMGDRWDAWTIGYNQVFSPYSSPNTKDRSGNQTGIFIIYDGLSSNTATVKVYQAAANTSEEEAILEATSPSKPMLYRAVEIANCNGTVGNPRIIWDNNIEPDMERVVSRDTYKRYKIYRAASTNPNVAPLTYTYHATYDDYTPNDTANFIDNGILNGAEVYCGLGGSSTNDTYFRYKIVAVDKYDDESVPSDFVSIKANSIIPDSPNFSNNEIPTSFSLLQNYPNPFNPSTKIKFELPQNTFVTLKVYNAVGQVVAELVNNEYKNAGRYSVNFDGTKLASGIYFYSLEAGAFKDVKKMVLIK